MTYNHIKEGWPGEIISKTKDEFVVEYKKLLVERMREGPRGLFLFSHDNDIVGLGNVFITRETEKNLLNVAELYIAPEFRRLGHGQRFCELMKQWGIARGCKEMIAEVDKDREVSHIFWRKVKLKFHEEKQRNVFTTSL